MTATGVCAFTGFGNRAGGRRRDARDVRPRTPAPVNSVLGHGLRTTDHHQRYDRRVTPVATRSARSSASQKSAELPT